MLMLQLFYVFQLIRRNTCFKSNNSGLLFNYQVIASLGMYVHAELFLF
jgi:hypothetical protein